MPDSSSTEPAQPETVTVDRDTVERLVALVPAVEKMKRTPWWVAWVAIGGVALSIVLLFVLAFTIHQERRQDQHQRAQNRAIVEKALQLECKSSAGTRKAFDDLLAVAVNPSSARSVELAAALTARLDSSAPHRDCTAEAAARARARGG